MYAKPSLTELKYVCQHMRERSREEMYLRWPNDDPLDLAYSYFQKNDFMWVGYYDGKPAAIIGGYPVGPQAWTLFGFGTDDYEKILRTVTKHAIRFMMPAIKATGAEIAGCISPVDHIETHRWLEWLGAVEDQILPGYGKNGEDCILFAWTKEAADVRRRQA